MDKNKNSNASAFPINDSAGNISFEEGLTKREYVATQLMAGYLARDPRILVTDEIRIKENIYMGKKAIIQHIIDLADELLKESEEKQ